MTTERVTCRVSPRTKRYLKTKSKKVTGRENMSLGLELVVEESRQNAKRKYKVTYVNSAGRRVSETVTNLDEFIRNNGGIEFICEKA